MLQNIPPGTLTLIVTVLVIVIVGTLVGRALRKRSAERASLVVVAQLVERDSASAMGGFSALLMVVWNALAVMFLFSGSARGAIQEAVVGLIWIAGNQVLSLGVLLGRDRRYDVIQRQEHHEPIIERQEPY